MLPSCASRGRPYPMVISYRGATLSRAGTCEMAGSGEIRCPASTICEDRSRRNSRIERSPAL